MRFEHLEILDKLISEDGLVEVVCDIETLCAARAQAALEMQNYHEYARWDAHALSMHVVCGLVKDENKRRDDRK